MSQVASREHPDPNVLAAFVEGKLQGAELQSTAAHLRDCEECRGMVREAAAFEHEEQPVAARPARMWWLAAAAVIGLIALLPAIRGILQRRDLNESVGRLRVAASQGPRDLEPRLSDVPYAPLRKVTRGGEETTDAARLRLLASSLEVEEKSKDLQSPEARHAAALALLLRGEAEGAIGNLSSIPEGQRDATLWNDLAAAHYAEARRANDPAHLNKALAAADHALHLNPSMPEAMFNRALILERLGSPESGKAWKAYLASDPQGQWADEAKRHEAQKSRI